LRQAFRTEPARTTMIATNARPLLAPFESFRNVRFGSKADICGATNHVRFTPKSGHVRCTSLCRRSTLRINLISSKLRNSFGLPV
jgi:hypothetical protein